MEKIQQLYTITGARGVGKTRLAATYLPPSRMGEVVYFDSEKSANNIRRQLLNRSRKDFGLYVDLEDVQKRFGFKDDNDTLDRLDRGETPWMNSQERDAMLEYYLYIVHRLKELTPNMYNTLVIDVADKLEHGMRAWANKNRARLGVAGDHGKMEVGLFRPMYETLFNAIWGRGIETIILCFHLRNVWDQLSNKPVPNKVQMAGNIVLYQRSSIMLWLVSNTSNPNGEPSGLVIKEREGLFDIDEANDEWTQKRTLPYKIPVCDWKHINQYLNNGLFDPSHPKPDEMWNDDERDMTSQFYNNAQMALMMKDLEVQEKTQAVLMAEAGGLYSDNSTSVVEAPSGPWNINTSNPSLGVPGVATLIVRTIPATRSEAMKAWIGMGRKVPALNARLEELGIEDDRIGERWTEIVGD